MSTSERTAYRIAVVCTGNICRSPMGEWVLRDALRGVGIDGVEVTSGGTSAEETGNPMDPRTIAVMRRHGHHDRGWDTHRARRFTTADLSAADLVLAADRGHERALRHLAQSKDDRAKVRLLRSFDPASAAVGDLEMDDPWWGADASFEHTYAEVHAALPGILAHVRRAISVG